MADAASPDDALEEVAGYVGLDLSADDIRSLYQVLNAPRLDTAILSHLKAAHHVLGDLPHLSEGDNWWDKVHADMLTAAPPYVEQLSGSHKNPAPNDRDAVIFWLESRILPALNTNDASGGAPTAGRGVDWTEAEVTATVDDYLDMLVAEAAGRDYSKADHRRALIRLLNPGRTESAIEFKHQNLSAAMINLGLPYIRGYLPRGNYQAALATEIQRRLEADPSLLNQIMPPEPGSEGRGELQLTDAPPARARTRAGRHVDYGKLQEESRRVGTLGEELVVDYERQRLLDAGLPDLADNVQWVARDIGDGLGYDVQSFEQSGEELYIEVKSTGLAAETPFYFSSAELDFARRHPQTYALYRVSHVDDSPQFFVLRGPDIAGLEMVPVTYQARLPPGSANGSQPHDGSS
jgi:Domain of unknown function (DUF3883)